MNRPHIFETFASYSHLVKGNRLVSLNATEQSKSGNAKAAIQALYKLIDQEKAYLRESDTLIARMIANALLSETLEVLSLITQQYGVNGEPIKLLSSEQLSLNRVMNREFAYVKSGFEVVYSSAPYRRWPEWMVRLVLKPNVTVNAVVPVYANAKRMSVLSMQGFAQLGFDE